MRVVILVGLGIEALLLVWTGLLLSSWISGYFGGQTPGPATLTPWQSFSGVCGPTILLDLALPAALLVWRLAKGARAPGAVG